MEAHDGRIWVDAAPTGGSVFTVEIPIASEAPEVEPSTARTDVGEVIEAAADA